MSIQYCTEEVGRRQKWGWAAPAGLVNLSAAGPAALDLAAEQRAGGGAEDGAGGALATGIDGAADQRAAGGADNQAGGAVRPLAAQPAFRIPPDLAVVTRIMRGRRRRQDRHRYRRGGQCENLGAQTFCSPVLQTCRDPGGGM